MINDYEESIQFTAYGVQITIFFNESDKKEYILEIVEQAIPKKVKYKKKFESEFIFEISRKKKGKYNLVLNDEIKIKNVKFDELIDRLETQLRITVAEFATSYVFIHAGVVGWKNKAIIIPAKSFKGKTTLVVELVKAGATYYSDEYAVIDKFGHVHPYPKLLSVRGIIDDYTQLERSVDFYGGKTAESSIASGLILISEYVKHSHFKPSRLSQGEAVLELISNTIPIRSRPAFSMSVLNKLANNTLSIKTKRGEAKYFAKKLLNYCDENIK